MGEIDVPADRYWGAQTQRSLIHFSIGDDRMPKAVYHAYGYVKKAAAIVNGRSRRLPAVEGRPDREGRGRGDRRRARRQFPLYVWQTGSGTQSNMNVNEVISNRCLQLVGRQLGIEGSDPPQRPREHGQSSQRHASRLGDAHRRRERGPRRRSSPASKRCRSRSVDKATEWIDVVKIGRTHLQDATPLTVGQEWSGYAPAAPPGARPGRRSERGAPRLAIGGTAVGTGLNAPDGFGEAVAAEIARTDRLCLRPPPRTSSPPKEGSTRWCGASRRTSCHRRAPDEDRQRPPLAGLGPAERDR